jgi:hypothetical protein
MRKAKEFQTNERSRKSIIDKQYTQLERVPKMVKQKHIYDFLDPNEKIAMSQVYKSSYQDLKFDNDIQCLKSTLNGLTCTGLVNRYQIQNECMNFCVDHINLVMKNFINIAFSGKIFFDEDETLPNNGSVSIHDSNEIILLLEKRKNKWVLVTDSDEFDCTDFPGNCITNAFDFRSNHWSRVLLEWDISDEFEDAGNLFLPMVDGTNIEMINTSNQPGLVQFQFENKSYVNDKEWKSAYEFPIDDIYPFNCVEHTRNSLGCTGMLKDVTFGDKCETYCHTHLKEAIVKVVRLMIQNRVFIEDQNGFIQQVHVTETNVEINDSSIHIHFQKESNDVIVKMFVQTETEQIYLQHFRQVETGIIFEIAEYPDDKTSIMNEPD